MLSGALKIADKVTVAMEAVGDKINNYVTTLPPLRAVALERTCSGGNTGEASEFTWGNNYVTTLPPLRAVGRSEGGNNYVTTSPLSVPSGALKIAGGFFGDQSGGW